jgi:hypothetical protein
MLISEEFRIRTSEANFEENKIVIEENKILIDNRWMQPHPHIAGMGSTHKEATGTPTK